MAWDKEWLFCQPEPRNNCCLFILFNTDWEQYLLGKNDLPAAERKWVLGVSCCWAGLGPNWPSCWDPDSMPDIDHVTGRLKNVSCLWLYRGSKVLLEKDITCCNLSKLDQIYDIKSTDVIFSASQMVLPVSLLPKPAKRLSFSDYVRFHFYSRHVKSKFYLFRILTWSPPCLCLSRRKGYSRRELLSCSCLEVPSGQHGLSGQCPRIWLSWHPAGTARRGRGFYSPKWSSVSLSAKSDQK